MQRNKNCRPPMGPLLLLAALAIGCNATGKQAESPALSSKQYMPGGRDGPDYGTAAYASATATPHAAIHRLSEAPGARQTTCPVTDAQLGSMGAPVPVEVDGRTVYVCCAGCVEELRENPEKYLRDTQPVTGPGTESSDAYSHRNHGRTSSNSSAGGSSCCH